MALPMEELHIWLIIIKKNIMEHNKAPCKQLMKLASRSRCKRIWHDNTKLTFARARWKSPCNALWKNPTYIYLGSRICLCFFHRKKIKAGPDVEAADTEEFQRRSRRGPWSGLPCPQGEECLITEPAAPLCRVSILPPESRKTLLRSVRMCFR